MICISLKISITKNLLYYGTVNSIKKKIKNNLNRHACTLIRGVRPKKKPG